MFLHNREELQNLRKEAEERLHAAKLRVLVCAGTGCIASGSKEIYDKMKEKYPVQENNDRDENLEMLPENEKEKRYPPGENWLGDMVQVVLLQEMCRRREERRKQRRWY